MPIENVLYITNRSNLRQIEKTKSSIVTILEGKPLYMKFFIFSKEKKKFMNLFDGLDNSKPFNFDYLKKETFKDIFSVKNRDA